MSTKTSVSRRSFLKYVGATFGSTAALNVMAAWGQQPEGQINPPQLDGTGQGTKVIVLGAGPGGCAAAYELMKLGYDVTVLEARDYVGGHALTVRATNRGYSVRARTSSIVPASTRERSGTASTRSRQAAAA